MIFPFGKHRGRDISEIPDTYLDWVIGQQFFYSQPRNEPLIVEITRELATRKRSRCYVEDERGKTMEDL